MTIVTFKVDTSGFAWLYGAMDKLNLFSLHGKYFGDDENRFTANVLFMLSEFRSSFLPAFLSKCGATLPPRSAAKVRISFQVPHQTDAGSVRIPDGEIRLGDDFHLLLEAKIGTNPLTLEQLKDYASHLSHSPAENRRLVCITQGNFFSLDNRNVSFEELKASVEPSIVPVGTCLWLRWSDVLNVLKSSVKLTPEQIKKDQRRALTGKPVDYARRVGALFLEEVETTMYDKKEIDAIPLGEVEDITVAVQNKWFMDVALRHNIWFPNSRRGRVSKYVAHYETAAQGNKNPKTIAYIARNRTMWNRISIEEAKTVPELQSFFADPFVAEEIETWPFHQDAHCIVLTDTPVRLREPLQYKDATLPNRMAGWYAKLSDLCNAQTIDDLFPPKSIAAQ